MQRNTAPGYTLKEFRTFVTVVTMCEFEQMALFDPEIFKSLRLGGAQSRFPSSPVGKELGHPKEQPMV